MKFACEECDVKYKSKGALHINVNSVHEVKVLSDVDIPERSQEHHDDEMRSDPSQGT